VAALSFETIQEKHVQEITRIYNYYVLNSTISFHTEERTEEQMRLSLFDLHPRFESYLITQDHEVRGYVLIAQHKNKQAYDVTGEVTIYLKPDCQGRGIGGQALGFIEEVAREQGFHTLVATVCMENEKSRYLFERHGYSQCALYKEIGYKFGRRLDIAVFQKIL
jgi:L-amino acid N-acyltransferase YncA